MQAEYIVIASVIDNYQRAVAFLQRPVYQPFQVCGGQTPDDQINVVFVIPAQGLAFFYR